MSCSWGMGSKRKLLSKESSCLIPGSPHSHGSPKPPERPPIIPGAQADWHSPISPCCAGTAAKLVASRHLHTAALGQRRRAVRSRSSLRLAGGDPVRDKKGPDPLAQVLQHTGCQGNGDLMFFGGAAQSRDLPKGSRAGSARSLCLRGPCALGAVLATALPRWPRPRWLSWPASHPCARGMPWRWGSCQKAVPSCERASSFPACSPKTSPTFLLN